MGDHGGARLQPVDPLTVEFDVIGVALREHEDVDWLVERINTNYRISDDMFLRGIGQGMYVRELTEDGEDSYHRYDLNLLYGWEFSPGSMLYIAYNQALERENGQQEFLDPVVIVKTSYLMSF